MMHTSIGESIKILRKRSGLSQGDLADRSGISRNAVSMIERDKTNVTIGSLMAISRVLGFNVEVSFKEVGDGPAQQMPTRSGPTTPPRRKRNGSNNRPKPRGRAKK